MKKYILSIALLFCASVCSAEESTNGAKEITQLYLNGTDHTHFYLEESCPAGKQYYVLLPSRVDVDRYYSTVMAAFYAEKKVDVKYEINGAYCEVARIFVRK